MILLVDIGNTRLKWAQHQAGKLFHTGAISHVDKSVNSVLLSAWQNMQPPEKILLACVSSKMVKQALYSIVEQLWPNSQIQEIQTKKYAKGVSNAYLKPEKLGVDRWLALLAAYHHFTAPICVVDCGTAITLDVIDQQGMHLGGMIMPGLSLMKQALHRGTADLNVCSEVHKLGLANDTEAAIFNGNLNAIKGFIELGLAQYNKPLQLIVTRGVAKFLADILKLDAIVDTELVFKGLALSSIEQK